MDTDVKVRYFQNNLVTCGLGIITLGLWTNIKALLHFFTESSQIIADTAKETGLEEEIVLPVFIVVIALIVLIITIWHIQIGMSSIRVGRGRKKHHFYILSAMLLIALNMYDVFYLFDVTTEIPLDAVITTIILDTTLTLVLLDMIISHFALLVLKKR